jgi:hypothetical protein
MILDWPKIGHRQSQNSAGAGQAGRHAPDAGWIGELGYRFNVTEPGAYSLNRHQGSGEL